jgi:hypothetical protein
MRLHIKEQSRLKRPFIVGGVVLGVVASSWYLLRNQAVTTLARSAVLPDPVWTRFVNVALIMFIAIYLANLLRRLVELLMKAKDQ